MKKSILLLIAIIALIPALLSARDYSRLHLSDVEVSLSEDNHAVNVSMTVNPRQWKLSLNRCVVLIPVIRSATSADTLALEPVTVAGKNKYYSLLRAGNPGGGYLLRAGKDEALTYSVTVPMERWMTVSDIDFTFHQEQCCGEAVAPDEKLPFVRIDLTPAVYKPTLAYMEPPKTEKEPRHLSGKAYVVFPVNKTHIDPMYEVDGQRPNIQELGKITNTIDSVRRNPDVTVNSITLTGFASPEGPYKNNVRLAAGRTEAVKEYVRKMYDFPASVYHVASVPEDWEGLRDSVAVSILPDREQIVAFIDEPMDLNVKNDRLKKQFPESYKYLLANVYPWLRHTNYDITYTIKEYDDIDEIMSVLATRPHDLSLREFYLAASSLREGSPAYDDVWRKAVVIYPADSLANINAAYACINRGDITGASRHLEKAGNGPDADFARGILDASAGRYDNAISNIDKAKTRGHAKAAEALAEIARVRSIRPGVTYTYSE